MLEIKDLRASIEDKEILKGVNLTVKPGEVMIPGKNNNDEILALHKQGKSVLEIAKELSMAQGEVKLVIDLFGR